MKRHIWCLTLILTSIYSLQTVANETEDSDSSQPEIEEVVVVGTLIRRKEVFEGRAPVQVLDTELLRSVGASQPVDILSSLTSNTGSYLATQQTYLQGVSQFSLRGVGLSSTLTLINGRRAGLAPVSNDVGQSFFDINSLPVLMIDRVEILRDGASATYGSQAVAGVANIVTRKDLNGLEVAGGYRGARNDAFDVSVAGGFDVTRGYINLYGTWYEQNEIFRTDFEWMSPRAIDPNQDGDIVEGSFDSGRGSPGSFRRAIARPGGTFVPFQVDGLDTPRFPDPDCRLGGGYPSGSLCRMDFSDQRTMIAAEKRAQYFTDIEFNLTDQLTLVSEIGYSSNEVKDRVGNMLLFNGNVDRTNEFFVPSNHPFNFWTDPDSDGILEYIAPEDWIPEEHEAVSVGYFGRPIGAEAFGRNSGDELRQFENLRISLGFRNDFLNGWTSEAHFTQASSDLSVSSERHWEAAAFANSIIDGTWNPFGTRLVSPDLVTPKTPEHNGLNPALIGKRAANDREALKQFERVRMERARSVLNVGEIMASGDISEGLDEPIQLAVGAQFRDLYYSYQPDPLNEAGTGPRELREFPRESEQRVWAVFAESLTYLGSRTEIQLAARHERYDQAGNTTDPKIAAQFFVNDTVSLRFSWGTSFQSPSVFQVAGNTSARTLTDPFRFDGQGVGQCTVDSTGEIINRGDNFNSVAVLHGADLKPQSAQSMNIGSLIRPSDSIGISLDYWSLDYRNVIAQGRSFQAIVDDDCRDDGRPNDPRIQRDSSGQLSIVSTTYQNVGAVKTQGIDANTFYDFNSSVGDFRVSADTTILTRFDVNSAGEGFIDRLGSRNDTNGFAPTPAVRVNLGLSWNRRHQSMNVAIRYIDSYKNDEVASQPKIASWTTLDANYRYAFENVLNGEVSLTLGARNLLDRDPPPLPTGQAGIHRYNLRPAFDGFVHDIKGRTVYLRFHYRQRD
ncbi:MAG: TonB-dependent receptor [Gammaproteobacteria bacterium]|nr:TonB-dependent receptor [Gammaproteobacteria bacterium]